MFENFNLGRFFRKIGKPEPKELEAGIRESKETAKERLHMVLMQDRANVSADFLELMKQEIIDVIKKYIEVDEEAIDVRLTTKTNEDGSNVTPSLYANIPILNIRNDMKVENYKFALQSDGSIIAQRIEESKDEEIKEIDLDSINLDGNYNIDNKIVEEKDVELSSNNIVESEKINDENNNKIEEVHNLENVIEVLNNSSENNESAIETDISKTVDGDEKENEKRVEERQNDIIKEIIPAMENIGKLEKTKENTEIEEHDAIDTNTVTESSDNSVEKVEEKKEESVEETVIPLKKSAKRGRPKKKDRASERKNKKSEKKKIQDTEDDEGDDDVTFDDLLKAAEEEDRKIAEQEKKRG